MLEVFKHTMTTFYGRYAHKMMVAALALLLFALLTACQTPLVVNDPGFQCNHPEKPENSNSDKQVSIYIAQQSQKIDTCMALLGHTKGAVPSTAAPNALTNENKTTIR